MLRKNLASSRLVRVGIFGLVATAAAVVASDSADAHRTHRHRHYAHHHSYQDAEESYSPAFASIIVDGNSGATLSATNPDGSRHPASLTKIMTLYLLFERLESGKMKLDTEMPVSEHASEQAPTKLGLKPGQFIRVEDAIKGLVTRSANDAAVVIAEAIGGDEDDFAKMMTRKAHTLGMSRTTYVNASGLPDDAQVTTARDQSILGRAIQDRFPRYYKYFSTESFNYHGQSIKNHNHLLGKLEGVDGIKTGYTRASGFNLVTSMRRGNRFLVGVVLGGHSGSSRDAIMRNLLTENLDKAASKRTVAAITERNAADANADVADAAPMAQGGIQVASADPAAAPADEAAATPSARVEPAPLTSGVIQTQPIATIPGSSEPMKPVKVKTVQVKARPLKLASVGSSQPVAPPTTSSVAPVHAEVAESSNGFVAKPETLTAADKVEPAAAPAPGSIRPAMTSAELPPQPPGHGTGNGILGVLPASSLPPASAGQAMAYADPAPQQPQPVQQSTAAKPVAVHTGW